MGSRDHSVTCETCGESYGGMNSDTEEHECSDMVNVEESPGVYVYRKRRRGECFCHAYDDSECACGGLRERRETDRQSAEVHAALSTLASNLAVAGALCAAFELGMTSGRRSVYAAHVYPNTWHPGCGRPAADGRGR